MTIKDVFGVASPVVKSLKTALPCVYPGLVIGVELETESVSHRLDLGAYEKPLNIFAKTDASLRGNAYEFITKPMRSDHCLSALKQFFTLTGFNEDNYSDRCSVHVHVNCTDMELSQVSSVALLYTVLEEILFEFVGHNRDTNIYCIPWSHCRAHLNLVQKFLSNAYGVLNNWNKYTALNLIPLHSLGTVEFRQMHGTADMEKLTTWINLIGAIFKYAKAVGLKDLMEEIKTLNTTSEYEMFFTKVTAGQLPYNDVYREKLEAGIIFAKYSLTGMFTNKRSGSLGSASAAPQRAVDVLNAVIARYNQAAQIAPRPLVGAAHDAVIMAPPPEPFNWAVNQLPNELDF